jgi:hypothetical protein
MEPNQKRRPEKPAQRTLFIALRCGRLANRMVLFANFIAFAVEHGCRLVNFTFHTYADLFETTRLDFYCQFPVAKKRSRWDALPPVGNLLRRLRLPYHLVRNASRLNECFGLFGKNAVTLRELPGRPVTLLDDPEIGSRLGDARTVFVYDWRFRAPDLVRRHAKIIRAYFQPVPSIVAASGAVIARLRRQAEIVVGVHVRRGDYRTWNGGRYFYPVKQFAEWMREMAAQFPGRTVAFLVASDEPRRAEEFSGLTVDFCPGSPVADIYALAGCDYIFGPPSTYSQWASFHGNKPLFHLYQAGTPLKLENFAVSFLGEIP